MKFALAAAFISVVLSAVQAHPEPAAAASLQRRTSGYCCYPTTPLLRAFKASVSDHFYTTNSSEVQHAVTALGYHQEGDAAQIHAAQTPITVPLYRLYSASAHDHFYTTSASQRDNAAANLGYAKEGITGYVYETPLCGTVPLYRMYNGRTKDHFYTTSAEQRDNAVNNLGYTLEHIAAYVNPQA